MNCEKLRTPSRNAECVCRKMSSAAARFWNQVPLAESAFPTKYGPNERRRISANAAAGPTAELTPDFVLRACPGVGRRRGPAPLLGEAPLVRRVPSLSPLGHLRHRQADAPALDSHGRDLRRRHSRGPQPLEIVVVLEER